MGTAVMTLAAYLALWERRNAAIDRQVAAHTAWVYASVEESDARWQVYRDALAEAGTLTVECVKAGEQLVQARGGK